MKSIAAVLAAILMLACLALPVPALESKVLTLCEKNLSVDLPQGVDIVSTEFNASDNSMISNDFYINSATEARSAFISILTVYDEILKKLSPDALVELFLVGGMEAVEERGDVEIGQWTALDSRGRNVSVITMRTGEMNTHIPDGIYNIAVWNMDEFTYALVISSLDKDNTTKIIETLRIVENLAVN